jgi:transcriptional regulator with GAF, ATPase, and Fis domain
MKLPIWIFSIQVKLLRVLQEREITRVGSNQIIPIDVRIITATHKNLSEEVRVGLFREDLFLSPLRFAHTAATIKR